ncbi:MAG: hypothetical protein DI556_00405 [Rhodovulum sulfidophilum]|uniref:DUF3775 domain-containing protein n=1 Tax=Rhodovulum sulfidophilum TaxID=35806 RepID=A0A2W5NGF9_RHOSU|nr:MAG: hypothetical protein DI556_00405 [Rhodovulum sulfidophilum]
MRVAVIGVSSVILKGPGRYTVAWRMVQPESAQALWRSSRERPMLRRNSQKGWFAVDEEISLNPEFLRSLVLKLRAIMAQEELVSPDSGSNPTDDEGAAVLQDSPDNMTRSEIAAQVEDLEPDQQAELVALMWIGRGDMEPEEWREAVQLAMERRDRPTSDYLLSHPQVADDLADGVDKLFDGSDFLETGAF